MTLEALKQALNTLTPDVQQSVEAYINVLKSRKDPEYPHKLAARLDNEDSDYWVLLEEAEKRWVEADAQNTSAG